MANIQRLRQILQIIKDNPQHWNQSDWHCGTSHCFAGFADCLANGVDFKKNIASFVGYESTCISLADKAKSVEQVAKQWLELSEKQADLLFRASNYLQDLEMFIDKIERDEL